MSKKRIGVVFGGRSVEHEVSIITALQALENLDPERYEGVPLYIAKSGVWYTGEVLKQIDCFKREKLAATLQEAQEVLVTANPQAPFLIKSRAGLLKGLRLEPLALDVVLPAIHGSHGEDGSLQGLLELGNIPYTSAGLTGSAVGMDKVVMKSVFRGEEIPIVDYTWFYRRAWEDEREKVLLQIEEKLAYPMVVKPASLGSSVGIALAKEREGLVEAIEVAKSYDRRVIVEAAVPHLIEINCSVVGFGEQVEASLCERPVAWQEILSYEDKYVRGNYVKGKSESKREIPARIPEETAEEIRCLAKQVFRALDCRGVARIDFLMNGQEMRPLVNEINTIPGSLAFYLWEAGGLSFSQLLHRLIEDALASHQESEANLYSVDYDLIDRFRQGQKAGKQGGAT